MEKESTPTLSFSYKLPHIFFIYFRNTSALSPDRSITEYIIHKNYMDPICMMRISGNQKLTADRIRRLAIGTFTSQATRSLDVKSLRIGWSCNISGTFHRLIKIRTYLIHSHNKYYLVRSLCNAGNSIRVTVYIYNNSINLSSHLRWTKIHLHRMPPEDFRAGSILARSM